MIKGYASGGGIYIEYSQQASLINEKNLNEKARTVISITDSVFVSNQGTNISAHPSGSGTAESRIGFGRGGAISVFFLNSTASSNIRIEVSKCQFENNTAAWGGSIYVRFRDQSAGNIVNIKETCFTKNYASLSGGALFVTSTQTKDLNNTVHLDGCQFNSNAAEVGGAVGLKWIAAIDFVERSRCSIRNTTFSKNVAKVK